MRAKPSCLPCIRRHNKQSAQDMIVGKSLPLDIIFNIFARLPAKLVLLCCHLCKLIGPLRTTPSFVDMHLQRATPISVFQYFSPFTFDLEWIFCFRRKRTKADIKFMDEKTQKYVRKSIKVDLCFTSPLGYCIPYLYGSCDGFLLFKNICGHSALCIWNPTTQEQVIVASPNLAHNVSGFYFHPASREYRVLFRYQEGRCFKFIVLSLATKLSRKLVATKSSTIYPMYDWKQPIVANGSLHWMVDDDVFAREYIPYNIQSPCSNAILLFNIDKEEFSTITHPGHICVHEGIGHQFMPLTAVEGSLCYCEFKSLDFQAVIWILEGYETQIWVRRHVVNTMGRLRDVIHIHGDDIVVNISDASLFLCNLRLGTVRNLVGNCPCFFKIRATVAHVDSLVSLNVGGRIDLSI